MDPANGLALVVSTLALALAAFSYLRGVPARVLAEASNAQRIAERIALEFETFKAEATNILGAVQEERERTQKSTARRTATDSRARQAEALATPQTRDEVLAELRPRAGLI